MGTGSVPVPTLRRLLESDTVGGRQGRCAGSNSVTLSVRPGTRPTRFDLMEERDIVKSMVARLIKEEEGQDLIEYALLAAFIAVAVIAAVKSLGTKVNGMFSSINASLS
jgi:pilus assembly protein Flp/PilA